jgi:hypothetical protein
VGYLFDVMNLLSLGLVESSETNVGGSLLILEPQRKFSRISCRRGVQDKLLTVKVCILARIVVVPAGVIVILGLCNRSRRGINSQPNLGRSNDCTPLCGFLSVVHSAWGREAE